MRYKYLEIVEFTLEETKAFKRFDVSGKSESYIERMKAGIERNLAENFSVDVYESYDKLGEK